MKKKGILSQYKGVSIILKRYWLAYGGTNNLFRSPYLHISLLFVLAMTKTWSQAGWWNDIISIIPGLLGFSIAAFAIVIGFGGEKFLKDICTTTQSDESHFSIYMGIMSIFAHFIIVQVLSLLYAILRKSLEFKLGINHHIWINILTIGNFAFGLLGYILFTYAITLTIASCMAVFRLASLYNDFIFKEKQKEDNELKKNKRNFKHYI